MACRCDIRPPCSTSPLPLDRCLDRLRLRPQWRQRYSAPKGHCPNCRSEEHTSELQSLMRISYAVFCLKKKKINKTHKTLIDNIEHNITLLAKNQQGQQ